MGTDATDVTERGHRARQGWQGGARKTQKRQQRAQLSRDSRILRENDTKPGSHAVSVGTLTQPGTRGHGHGRVRAAWALHGRRTVQPATLKQLFKTRPLCLPPQPSSPPRTFYLVAGREGLGARSRSAKLATAAEGAAQRCGDGPTGPGTLTFMSAQQQGARQCRQLRLLSGHSCSE